MEFSDQKFVNVYVGNSDVKSLVFISLLTFGT